MTLQVDVLMAVVAFGAILLVVGLHVLMDIVNWAGMRTRLLHCETRCTECQREWDEARKRCDGMQADLQTMREYVREVEGKLFGLEQVNAELRHQVHLWRP